MEFWGKNDRAGNKLLYHRHRLLKIKKVEFEIKFKLKSNQEQTIITIKIDFRLY